MTTHWPEVGSQWKRTVTHGAIDKHEVRLPYPVTYHLTIHKIDPENDLGRQIQGFVRRDPPQRNEFNFPSDTYYTTSHIIFWETWEPVSAFKREEEQ